MKKTTTLVGPRGWAALVLAGGTTLAAPFLRAPNTLNPPVVTSDESPPDFSPNAWPNLREQNLATADELATDLSDEDWQALDKLQAVSAQPRRVEGKLPNTMPDPFAPKLPSWADRGQRIDKVVDAAVRGEPLEAIPSSTPPEIQPLRTWTNASVSYTDGSKLTSSLANTLPAPSSDPFAAWTSSNQGPHSLARQLPGKPFEERPELWPDQKLSRGDLPISSRPGTNAIVDYSQQTAPEKALAGTQGSALANVQSTEAATFGSREPASPRVGLSSASRRETMSPSPPIKPLSSPPVHTSPTTTQPQANPPRQKHFIQQPAKRA